MIDGTRYGWQVGVQLAKCYQGPHCYCAEEVREIAKLVLAALRAVHTAESLLYPEEAFIANLVASFDQVLDSFYCSAYSCHRQPCSYLSRKIVTSPQ